MSNPSRYLPVLVCLLVWTFLSVTAHADRVVLKNGREIVGTIVKQDETTVVIESSGGRLSLPRATIEKIEVAAKADPAIEAIAQGDILLAAGKYAEAIEAYKKALAARPQEAQARIDAVEKARDALLEKQLDGMPTDVAEKQLRSRLANPSLTKEQSEQTKAMLARVLIRKAEGPSDRITEAERVTCLEEAWQLSPHAAGIAVALARALRKQNEFDPRVAAVLQPYVEKNPDDMEAVELLVRQIWKANPSRALKLVYPGSKPHPKATAAIKNLLPEILLACFNSKPYPADAPFDRDTCYQHLLALKPQLGQLPLLMSRVEKEPQNPQHLYDLGDFYEQQGDLGRAQDAFEAAQARDPKFKDVAKRIEKLRLRKVGETMRAGKGPELIDVLQELKRREGRDNAMIHYVAAGELMSAEIMKTVTRYSTTLIPQVLDQGWSDQAAPLLPLIGSFQPAFQEIRRGVALDYARNAGWDYGPLSPVPNFLKPQTAAKMLCVEGRYLESQGRYNDALNNYLTALTMGRDYGAPKAILISGLISVAIHRIAVGPIHRLAAEGRLDRPTLQALLARLKVIEATRGSMADMFRCEAELGTLTTQWMRESPRENMVKAFAVEEKPLDPKIAGRTDETAVKYIDKLEADANRVWEVIYRQMEMPYWKRNDDAFKRELEEKGRGTEVVVLNWTEAQVRDLVSLARLRETQIAVALSAYKLDKGSYPQTLAQLAPAYLGAVPSDPFSGAEFRYGPAADGKRFHPYSVGPDKADNGGSTQYDPKNGTVSAGDIFF